MNQKQIPFDIAEESRRLNFLLAAFKTLSRNASAETLSRMEQNINSGVEMLGEDEPTPQDLQCLLACIGAQCVGISIRKAIGS